ncbi:response regulator [Parvularcula sp. ZS-1/3]|uniref:Sensory/regulatory protein RpfC n=1 Tax=Parvularcula mediterranea TaxID=2732508 RepID=A0A7Y3RL16_9PROT|nr:ATP-binding protein [Parvularcula mediterranea]NNU15970.1 response regulator [Parvularcula mediterranea]
MVAAATQLNSFSRQSPDPCVLDEGRWRWDVERNALHLDPLLRAKLTEVQDQPLSIEFLRGRMRSEERSLFDEQLIQAVESARGFTFEHSLTLHPGEVRRYRTKIVVSKGSRHSGAEVLGRTDDIEADARRLEEALEARNASEAANRQKTDFLTNISHELRTPLNGVLGMAQLLSRTNLDPQQDKYVKRLSASGNALLSIIDDVLDLSRIESGQIEFEMESLDLPAMLGEVRDAAIGLAASKRLKLRVDLPEEPLPASRGDRKRINQVVLNLVGNAVKFTESGSVTMAVRQQGDVLRFSVTDTGLGISEEHQAKIFERFTQADSSSTRKFGGTGLGLAISRELIDSMNGAIGVESKLGEGSTFWFTLPCVEDGHIQRPTTAPEESEPTAPSGNAAVLLAEDNPVNQEIVEEMLAFAGSYEVTTVEDGKQALDMLRTRRFDIVLMDINMPIMTGDEAIRAIRRGDVPQADIPIIALTANALRQQRDEYLQAGADDYVPKPIDHDLLLRTIAGLVKETASESAA